jgi:hypothetical protein
MSEPKRYQGGCHCGKVRYEVTTDLARVIECNCSHCSRKAFLLNFVTPEAFTLHAGEGELSEYLFNKHVIHHAFCKTCGVQSFSWGTKPDGTRMYSVNVRCLDGVEPGAYTVTQVDGRSR